MIWVLSFGLSAQQVTCFSLFGRVCMPASVAMLECLVLKLLSPAGKLKILR